MTKDILKIVGDAVKVESEYLIQKPYDVFHRGAKDYLVNLLKAVRISATFKGGDVPQSTVMALIGIKLREVNSHIDLFPQSAYHRGALFGLVMALEKLLEYFRKEEEESTRPGTIGPIRGA